MSSPVKDLIKKKKAVLKRLGKTEEALTLCVTQNLLTPSMLTSGLVKWPALRAAIGAAAADGEFRLAAPLKDIAFVAEPQEPLTPAACAPPAPEIAPGCFACSVCYCR